MIELNQENMVKYGVKDTLYINKSNKLIYVHIPKCASNSCLYGIQKNINKTILDKGPYKKEEALKFPDYFCFTFVRKPWDRLVSCYCDRVIKKREYDKDVNPWDPEGFVRMGLHSGISFERFVEIVADQNDENSDYHWRSLHSFITVGDKFITDFIGKVENMDNDWKKVCKHLNWVNRKVYHKNKSIPELRKSSDYRDYYNKKTRKLVAKRFEKDIDIFKYTY
jgi:hypothetical protein